MKYIRGNLFRNVGVLFFRIMLIAICFVAVISCVTHKPTSVTVQYAFKAETIGLPP